MSSIASKRSRPATASQPLRTVRLNELERRLLDAFQRGFPLSPTPFQEIADRLGTSEEVVLGVLKRLQRSGIISRIGPVFKPKRIGSSTLAAMSIPQEELDRVAAVVSSYVEVNHNYERENEYNLWFVITSPSKERLQQVLGELESRTGYPILDLPLVKQHHIDLGFPLWC
ncbi:MAG: Lrp/AsnC family transcriptional regulator [Gammaproteobacteria bacterium]|nr:Lrp/AsnC family transcriptional regulator [Gammaproteobacteria bacterium]